jgi:hypothetical protein
MINGVYGAEAHEGLKALLSLIASRQSSASKDTRELAALIWGHYYSAERGAAEIERIAQARAEKAEAKA